MLLALLAGLSFLIVGAVVGVRMLLLARRTRGIPEWILGSGLCALVFVTIPCITIGFGLRLGPVWLEKALFLAGLGPVIGFAVALFAFTAIVFRPASIVAWSLVVAAGVVATTGMAGTVATRFAEWDADRVVSVHWTVMMVGAVVAGFLWSGLESLRYHWKLRRRLQLGLADPVVCNRFLLWGVGGLATVAGVAVVIVSLLLGWRVVSHPVPVLGLACALFSTSITWWLAFVPPAPYLARLRANQPLL